MKAHSNSTSLSRMVKVLGWGVMVLLMYAACSTIILLASMVLMQKGIAPNLPWVASVQHYLYWNGARKIWQAQPACVEYDADLIYKPRYGACKFENPEFKTILNFSSEGRSTGAKPEGTGIAIVGDSHAMGWGVNDEETFATVLQNLIKRPVYNLAVASYATERELVRLEKSGLLSKVDTVILQYNSGDLPENQRMLPATGRGNKEKFEIITKAGDKTDGTFVHLKKLFDFTFRIPLKGMKELVLKPVVKVPMDFSSHYQPLIDIFGRHPGLGNKRVIIFYSNGDGDTFSSFPTGIDERLPHVEFIDLHLAKSDYYRMDDHLRPDGHRKVALQLNALIQNQPAPR